MKNTRTPVIRITLVEDNADFRNSLVVLFRGMPGFEVVGAHGSAESATRQLAVSPPDVLLLDLELPGRSGLDLLREWHPRRPSFETVILTLHQDPAHLFQALESGASGYLVKPAPMTRVVDAVTEVLQGGAPMSPGLARLVLKRFREQAVVRHEVEGLTPREADILRRVSEGALPEEVAAALGISARTVATHLLHVYRKLHVRTRAQAVAKYLGQG